MNDPVAKARKRRAELHAELAEIERFLAASEERDEGSAYAIADAAWRALHEARQPLGPAELTEAVEANGTRIPSADKIRFLAAILANERKRFVNIAGHGYWLAQEDCARAGYIASRDSQRDETVEAQLEDLKVRTSGT